MSIAHSPYTSHGRQPSFTLAPDPIHDIIMTVAVNPEASLGHISVSLDRGPFDLDAVSVTEYVATLRQFADHLQVYCDAYEYVASVGF